MKHVLTLAEPLTRRDIVRSASPYWPWEFTAWLNGPEGVYLRTFYADTKRGAEQMMSSLKHGRITTT